MTRPTTSGLGPMAEDAQPVLDVSPGPASGDCVDGAEIYPEPLRDPLQGPAFLVGRRIRFTFGMLSFARWCLVPA